MSKHFVETQITGEGFRTLAIYRHFYKGALAIVRKADADYQEEVRSWYEEGEGRSPKYVTDAHCYHCGEHLGTTEGRDDDVIELLDSPCSESADGKHEPSMRRVNIGGEGHTFPHCPHGTSLWTDYDNICGACEDGYTAIQQAQGVARERFIRFNQRWDWIQSAPGDLDYDTRRELEQWAISIWLELFPKTDDSQEG